MKRFFKNLFPTRRDVASSMPNSRFQPHCESLETRVVMNSDFTTPGLPGDDMAEIEDDVLYVRGTDASNIITVEYDLNDYDEVRVTVYEMQGSIFNPTLVELDSDDFDIDDFERIEIRGFGADDIIANMTNLDTYMFGGTGSDWMYSGGGDDVMAGEADNDEYNYQHTLESIYFNSAYNPNYNGVTQSYNIANFGHDTIVEEVGGGYADYIRLDDLNAGATLNLANANTQIVSYNELTLTLESANGVADLEKVRGTYYNDHITGNDLNNYIYALGGNDTIIGGAGNDYLHGSSGNDVLEGQTGNDSLYGSTGDDVYVFSNTVGNDLGTDYVREYNGQGQDRLDFSDMVDTIGYQVGINLDLSETATQQVHHTTALTPFNLSLNLWSSEIEDVVGSDMYDTIRGNALDNEIWGLSGGDNLYGDVGNDTLHGGSGNDYLVGEEGDDLLDGGSDDDRYKFRQTGGETDLGHDTIQESANADTDTLDFYGMSSGVVMSIGSTAAQDVISNVLRLSLSSSTAIERVYGSNYDDVIYGNSRDNVLSGYSGNDTLYGFSGNDSLYGSNGRDYLYGGDDNDYISAGNDDDFLYGEGGLDTLIGGNGADYLNGDYLNHYVSDGFNDLLYGYTTSNNSDGDRDMFVHHRRYVFIGGRYSSVDAGWETLAGFDSSEDIRHYYYSWTF